MCNSVYKQTYCELPEVHEGAHRALIIEKPYPTRVEWNYACPTCHQEKPLDVIYINRLGMCQECAAQKSVQSDEATGCAHRAPRVIGDGLMFCDDCNTTLRR